METLNPTPETNPAPQQAKWLPWTVGALAAGLLGALAFGFVQYSNAVNTQLEVSAMQKEVVALRENLKSAQSNQSQTALAVEQLRGDLTSARESAARDLGILRSSSRKQAEAAAEKMGAEVTSQLGRQQQDQHQQVSQKLEEINRAAQQTTAKLAEVSTNVGAVRSDVASTKGELDKTIADLRRVVGDMGVMSGLIATNSKELAALKALGDRDYFEFTITKTNELQRVGDIQMKVKKVDLKRNRYTLEIVADDKKVEKKDKTVNEPVQFYVLRKARQPYELVVNEVKKNQIVGYLATPKVKDTRG